MTLNFNYFQVNDQPVIVRSCAVEDIDAPLNFCPETPLNTTFESCGSCDLDLCNSAGTLLPTTLFILLTSFLIAKFLKF